MVGEWFIEKMILELRPRMNRSFSAGEGRAFQVDK